MSPLGYVNLQNNLSSRKISQAQVVSHFMGFGNLNTDGFANTLTKGVTTNQDPSGKFFQKLQYKQKLLEEQMIENRVRKLQLDEERLKKQIMLANKHSKLADEARQNH